MKNIKRLIFAFLLIPFLTGLGLNAQVTSTNVYISPGNECGASGITCIRTDNIMCFDISIESDFTDLLSSYTFFIAETNCNIELVMPENVSCIMNDNSLDPLPCVGAIGEVFRSTGNTGTQNIDANTITKIHTFCVQLEAGQTMVDFSGFQLTTDFVNTPGDPTPVLTGVTGFNINDVCGPLPIELTEFEARLLNKNQAKLNWQTASEIDNDYFILQRRSSVGQDYENIAKIDGAGNSVEQLTYEFIDDLPALEEVFYYRLKQVDFDGEESLSAVRIVNRNIDKNERVLIYPNPNVGEFNIKFNVKQDADIKIDIMDPLGQVALKNIIRKDYRSGTYTEQVNITELPQGIYFLRLEENGEPKVMEAIYVN